MYQKIFRILSIIVMVVFGFISNPQAQDITEINITEGYAEPTFRELYTMIVMMGGFDIEKPEVLNEYGRLNYCNLYREFFTNDYEWNKIRENIKNDIKKQEDQFRVKYEVVEKFNVGRYDFNNEYFPIKSNRSTDNLGVMQILEQHLVTPYCVSSGGFSNISNVFSANIRMRLSSPLSINKISMSKSDIVEISNILDKKVSEGKGRHLYGRIRFTVKNASGPIYNRNKSISGYIIEGSADSVDFFYDEELSHKVEGVKSYN